MEFAMRFLLSLLMLFAVLHAAYYPSYHQLAPTKGLVNELKNFLTKGWTYYNESIRFTVRGEAQKYGTNSWCGDTFNRLKVYAPRGIKKVYITMTPIPNSSYFVLVKFIPANKFLPPNYTIDWTNAVDAKNTDNADYFDDRPFIIHARHGGILFEWPRYQDALDPQALKSFPGGWIYLQIIQASSFVNSQFGHIDNPSMGFAVKYYYDQTYQNSLIQWLKETKFDSQTGDPIDGFSSIEEKSRQCGNFGQKSFIQGIQYSDRTGYELMYGIQRDPNFPILNVTANRTTVKTGDSINFHIEAKSGNKSLDGITNIIDVELNQNKTVTKTGVLLKSDLGCMKFQQVNANDDLQRGVLLYSDNGNNWYKDKNNSIIMDNIRYVGYFVEDNFDANKKIVMDLQVKVDDNSCSLANSFKFYYMLDGEEKTLTKYVLLSRSSSSSTGESSYMGSGGSTGGTIGGGGSYSGDGLGSSSSSASGGKSQAQIYCESHGGRWEDGTCLSGGGGATENSLQSFSSSSSASGGKSQAQIYCESHGGRWEDGTCLSGGGGATENSSSSKNVEENTTRNYIEKVVATLAQKELPIQGYFVHYGSGAFDWIYYSSSGSLYKFEGMDERGYFRWTSLTEYFIGTQVRDGKLILGEVKVTRALDTKVLNTIRAIQSKDGYFIDGYFANYGGNAFDWVYVMGGKIYKLDGMNENGYFKWLPLTDYFDSIEVQDYTKIKIGRNRKEACEKILHGQWILDGDRWMCVDNNEDTRSSSVFSSFSMIPSSSSSSSSLSSSNNSIDRSSSFITSNISSSNSAANAFDNNTGAFLNFS